MFCIFPKFHKFFSLLFSLLLFTIILPVTSNLTELKTLCDKLKSVRLVLSVETIEKPCCVVHVSKRMKSHCNILVRNLHKIYINDYVIEEEHENITGKLGAIKMGNPWPGKKRCYISKYHW